VARDDSRAVAAFTAWFGFLRRWHRYEIARGFEHLDVPEARLVVGYHGRPIAHDLCMLLTVCHERLGYLPHPIFHAYFGQNGRTARWLDDLGFVTADGPAIAAAVARGEHIFVTPGGTREGCRPFWERYRVSWGERTGYVRMALQYGLKIVPVAADGTDDAFIGFNDGYAWGKRLHVPANVAVWAGLGLTGPWPFGLPLPVRIRQIIGAPIDPAQVLGETPDPSNREHLKRLHRHVVAAVQGLLDTRKEGRR
jgi:1-acyl-sn-glycerol-3-phosphate acyltransferase